MTPEEQNRLHIWWLLQQIKEENLATPSNSVVHFITGNADDDTENIPSTKKRNLLMCKFDEDLKIIKILEVEESNHYNGFTKTFFFKILQPKFDNTYKQYQTWAEYLKDPKGFQKKDITYIKARREIIEKNINAIYANINYLDKAEKDGWEKKLDVLKIIWTFYHSNNKPNTLRIPIQSLATKGRNIYEADGILDGLEKEGCWYNWRRGSVNYELEVIYYNDLLNTYNRTKEICEKFTQTYHNSVHKSSRSTGLLRISKKTGKDDKQQNSETKNLFPIPKGTTWQEITIKFKNEFDVDVIFKGRIYPSNYEEMGFADKRIKKPNEKVKTHNDWQFLLLLSTQNGVFKLDRLTGKQKEQKLKEKQSLSKKLSVLFPDIEDKDPFYPYSDLEKIYKIKLNLIPIKTFRKDFRDKDILEKPEWTGI